MPRGDRTGPAGMGPMTGRAAGYCAGADMPGFANAGGMGRGLGRGRGAGMGRRGGFGFRNQFRATGLTGWQRAAGAAPMPAEQVPAATLETLQQQAASMQATLDALQQQIQDLQNPQG